MRKILIIVGIIFVTNSYGQAPGAPTKKLTVEEANKLNGVASPTINGKPYSQYKAEQDAIKQQQASKQNNTVAIADPMSSKATGPDLNKPVKQQENMKGSDDKETVIVVEPKSKSEDKVVVKEEKVKTSVAEPEKYTTNGNPSEVTTKPVSVSKTQNPVGDGKASTEGENKKPAEPKKQE